HIVSIVAVFLALGMGILIGSTIVSNDVMVTQQQRIIDSLEEQFSSLREHESTLMAEDVKKSKMITHYENFAQGILGPVVAGQLQGRNLAVIVSGNQTMPSGILNTLSLAGANIGSQSMVLENINMKDSKLRADLIDYFALDSNTTSDVLRQKVAQSLALMVTNQADPALGAFLAKNNLIKITYSNNQPVDTIIMIGGSDTLGQSFPEGFDSTVIKALLENGIQVIGVENSSTKFSYMKYYQKFSISTVDNIDMSVGQIAMVLALNGQPGNYGIKSNATAFMPVLPQEFARRS
ncbi:MAG TPA: copper transporter, partial [Syntrophomonas sp.]|nr:copper transporter [Syntrophomonas sp.]